MCPGRTDPVPPATVAREDGFTLAELLTAFAVLGLVLAAVGGVHQAALQAYLAGDRKVEGQQNVRVALERIAQEIRQATAVTAGAVNSITLVPPGGAAVTYTVNAGSVTRNGAIVIGGVAALTFAYRDGNDAALAVPVGAPANIRRVDITIRTRSEDAS